MIVHISDAVERKLREKHGVEQFEILECFANRTSGMLTDDREEHKTNPPTLWFIAETDTRRRLKVVFIQLTALDIVVRTAYEPDAEEERLYIKKSRLRR